MKKIILLIVAALLSATVAHAQAPIRYQGEVDAGYSIGAGVYNQNRTNLHLINGIRFGSYFSMGIGLGFDIYHDRYYGADLLLPIFLNFKGYLPISKKVSTFLSFDVGAGVGLTEGVSDESGLLLNPAIGCAFKTTQKSAILMSVGYNIQEMSGMAIGAVSIKLGYQF